LERRQQQQQQQQHKEHRELSTICLDFQFNKQETIFCNAKTMVKPHNAKNQPNGMFSVSFKLLPPMRAEETQNMVEVVFQSTNT